MERDIQEIVELPQHLQELPSPAGDALNVASPTAYFPHSTVLLEALPDAALS